MTTFTYGITLGLLLAEGLHTWLARTDARRRRVDLDDPQSEYAERWTS